METVDSPREQQSPPAKEDADDAREGEDDESAHDTDDQQKESIPPPAKNSSHSAALERRRAQPTASNYERNNRALQEARDVFSWTNQVVFSWKDDAGPPLFNTDSANGKCHQLLFATHISLIGKLIK
uniref:Uncharacterized protein n=1 Tax=Ornithodoros erraticus TaxID=265619 RepID=A0A293M7C0_ORNER